MDDEMENVKLPKIKAWSQKIAKECDPALNSLLAAHFEFQKDFNEAFSQISLAINKEPQNKSLYEKMVWIAEKAGKLDQAKELIQSTLSNKPENYALWRSLGLTYLLKEDYTSATKNLQMSLKFKEDERTTHFLLGYSFLAALEKEKNDNDSRTQLSNSALNEFQKAGELTLLKKDSDFEEGKRFLNENLFSRSLEKMEVVLYKIKYLHMEPASFSYLALNFLMDGKEVKQNQVKSVVSELKKRSEQGKEYPEINNHLGLCYLIFWRDLIFNAQNQLRLAVKKDAKFQKAKTNLMFLESTEKKISALLKELKF
jgi:hypothetical protein